MFTFKSIVIRSIEAYELAPDDYNGIQQFFSAYFLSKLLLKEYKGKEIDLKEISIINNLVNTYQQEKNKETKTKYGIMIAKIISKKFTDIQLFFEIKEITESEYVPEYDLEVDRRKVSGCVATIIEV